MAVNLLTEKIVDCFRDAFIDMDGLTTEDVKKCGVKNDAQSEAITRYVGDAAYGNAGDSMLLSQGFSQEDVRLLRSVNWRGAMSRRIEFLGSVKGE